MFSFLFSSGRQEKNDADKRVHARVTPSARVKFEVHLMGDGFLETCHVRDISEGGLGLYVPHAGNAYDIGASLKMVIKIGRDKSFIAEGVIRHKAVSNRGFFGVQFTNVPTQARDQLREYIRQRLEEHP